MAKDIQEYVKGCAECQRHKINTQARKAPPSPITPVHEALPFQTITLDFIVKLPTSNGFDSILTITDHNCTKMAIFIPCNKSINAEGVANLYLHQVFPRFGLPSEVISDRDPQFISKFMREHCHLSEPYRICLQHIIPALMDNLNDLINGLDSTSDHGSMSKWITGKNIYLLPNSLTTLGETKPHAILHSRCSWDMGHEQKSLTPQPLFLL
jgi:hypothetical protein